MRCPASLYTFIYTFQSPNNDIRYSGTGTARALEYFFINSITGDISVRRPLTDDAASGNNLYVLTVIAEDQGVPTALRSTVPATVFIEVIRNQFSPVFVNTPYAVEVSQGTGQFATIFTVTATDSDLQVIWKK